MMKTTIIVASFLIAVSPASGQDPRLVVVDQNVGDHGPLSTSLRSISMDLRQPSAFGRVYRHPNHPDRLIRADGALYAVFPRSFYVFNRNGERRASIPAGTEFYIGAPAFINEKTDDGSTERSEAQANRHPRNRRYGSLLHPPAIRRSAKAPQPEPDEPVAKTIATDPVYRAGRLRELMRDAARRASNPAIEIVNDHAARGGPSSGSSSN